METKGELVTHAGASSGWQARCDRVERHSTALALLVVAIGAGVRLYYAWVTFLNPDEGMHFFVAELPNLAQVYDDSRSQAHPPLLVLLQHMLLPLGRSEFTLRLPSLLLGTATLWLIFRWVDAAAGRAAALPALLFACASPAMISASVEFRHTALLVFFASATLLAAQRVATQPSVTRVAWVGLSAAGGLLSHYSAIWIVAAVGLWPPLRWTMTRPPRAVWIAWVGMLVALAALAGWVLYIHGGEHGESSRLLGPGVWYLATCYYDPTVETLASFLQRAWFGAWTKLTGGVPAVAVAVLLLFSLGLLRVLRRRVVGQRRDFALLLLLPFVIATVAALLRVYPLGEVRHVSYLLPFAAAGFGIGCAAVLRERVWLAAALTLVAAPGWTLLVVPDNPPLLMHRDHLDEAFAFVEANVPQDEPIFIDYQTQRVLLYTLVGHFRSESDPSGGEQTLVTEMDGRRYVRDLDECSWVLKGSCALRAVSRMAQEVGLRPGAEVWLMSINWQMPDRLPEGIPSDLVRQLASFGSIRVLKMRLPAPAER